MGSQPVSELFLNNVKVLPLWVKQVLYLKTRDDLREELSQFAEVLVTDNLIQSYIPKLTFAGKQELTSRSSKLSDEFYTFLSHAEKNHDLFEITLTNYWTFAQTCLIYVRAVELQFISLPADDTMYTVMQFLVGKIRTGEIMKKLGKIDVFQLEKALRIQKEREAEGKPIKMAALMIELGYFTERDVNILFAFKEDSQKRLLMGVGFSLVKPKNEEDADSLFKGMQKEIKRLEQENRILKSRLMKILNIKG